MDFKTKYMIGLEERISLTEKLTNLEAQLKQQELINNDLLKHITTLEKFKCPNCSQNTTANGPKTPINNTKTPMNEEQDCTDQSDSRQAFEHLPFPSNSCKSTPNAPQPCEPVPVVLKAQPSVSGKKPFNYQQMNMLNNFDSSSCSESNNGSEKSDLERIDLDDDTLVPWTSVVKQNHPKLLNNSNQNIWEKYVLEFLDDRLDKLAYNKCYIFREGKYTWGIPDQLADDFEDFFEKMVVDGKVERLQNAKKKTPSCTPSAKKSHSKNSSAKSSMKKSTSKSFLDSSDDTSLPSTNTQNLHEFISWIDLVKDRLPHVAIDLIRMGEIALNFLDSEKLAKKKTKSSTGISSLGIPAGFTDDFISKISNELSPQKKKEKVPSEVSELIGDSLIGKKKIDGEYFFSWRDIAIEKFKHTALQDPRTRLFDCVLTGVQEFWENNVTEAQRKESRRIKSFHGQRASYGIPASSLNQFYEWYQVNLRLGFKEYDTRDTTERLKHPLDSNLSSESKSKKAKVIEISSDESQAGTKVELELLGTPFPVEPSPFAIGSMSGDYFSRNVLTTMNDIFPGSNAQISNQDVMFSFTDSELPRSDMVFPSTDAAKSDLTLYTDVLSSLMPSFTTLPISDRQGIKKHVELYISQKLGSSTRLVENIVSTISDSGHVVSTFGIPSEWKTEFTQWGILLLRGMYGVENVPLQSWEHFGVEIL